MRKLILPSLLIAVGIALFSQGSAIHFLHLSAPVDRPTSTPINPYAPAYYGIPNTIAGYNVLAVLTSDNLACMLPGEKRLVLQANESTLEEYLAKSQPLSIQEELKRLGLTEMTAGVEIAGPGSTLEQLVEEVNKWNQEATIRGCVQLGPTGSDPEERTH